MFLVTCQSKLDDQWEKRDEDILRVAGRKSDHSDATCDPKMDLAERKHVWRVREFFKAMAMRRRLINQVEGVTVTIREV